MTSAGGAMTIAEIGKDQAAEVFAKAARRYLNMSTEEFLEAMRSGLFESRPDLAHNAERVAIFLPLLEIP